MSLLSHFYQPKELDGIDELAMADWVAVLGDLPQAAIDQAAARWLRSEERRPTPAGIRRVAIARLEEPAARVADEKPFAPQVIPPEELERRREMAARVAARFSILKPQVMPAGELEEGQKPEKGVEAAFEDFLADFPEDMRGFGRACFQAGVDSMKGKVAMSVLDRRPG